MKSVHVSLSTLRREGHTEVARRYLLQALLVLNKGFNKGVGMNVEQLELTEDLVMSDELLPNLKLDDLKLFVVKAIRGDYGECYGGLDPNTVLVWLRRYLKERIAIGERISQQDKDRSARQPISRDAAWYQTVRDLDNHIKAWRKIARNGNNKQMGNNGRTV